MKRRFLIIFLYGFFLWPCAAFFAASYAMPISLRTKVAPYLEHDYGIRRGCLYSVTVIGPSDQLPREDILGYADPVNPFAISSRHAHWIGGHSDFANYDGWEVVVRVVPGGWLMLFAPAAAVMFCLFFSRLIVFLQRRKESRRPQGFPIIFDPVSSSSHTPSDSA
jgi:hypothetical protein